MWQAIQKWPATWYSPREIQPLLYIFIFFRMSTPSEIAKLQQRIEALEKENAMLRRDFSSLTNGDSVKVPAPLKPVFDLAQQTVSEYFRNLKMDPSHGTIEINDQRYVLVRASTLSKDFLDTVQNLYADRGEAQALAIGKNFLFDIAHVIGMNDARNFHAKMKLDDPIARLSAGPVHFAYSGWAFVDILPESSPTPDENFYLIYKHPYSFEADSWIRAGKKASAPVCIMNSGYSSGWCEESFGIPLTAVEVSCTAKGDDHCLFIMSPPHKIQEHLDRFYASDEKNIYKKAHYEIPTFFERKRVEEEMQRSRALAEESAKSKSDFIANMSHELRTPLGAILGFTDLLKKTTLDPVQKDYVESISSSGSSLLSLINDVLDLSKLDAGKFIIEMVPFSVPELVHSVQVMLSPKTKRKALQFSCSVDTSIRYTLLGDPMRLTQILINLVGNAIKFTEKGGVYVNCVVEEEDDESVSLLFSIRDTGIGIPLEKTETIFERFTQADTDITRRYGGTGLGLAITKQLVEMQGGSIGVRSEKGSGTEFYFSIPYTKFAGPAPLPVARENTITATDHSIKRILVVEDNLINQKLATVILENNGFDITVAANGSLAIDLLRDNTSGTFDLILMDIQMPVIDGYRATQVIRDELHIATPIIAMTAHALAGEKEKCIQVGMNDYLSKPFRETDLLNKIAQWSSAVPANGGHAPGKKIVDLSFLMTQGKNNRKFLPEMIDIFIQQTPRDLDTLQKAIDKHEYTIIYKTAHTLRNTVGYFGLTPYAGNELLIIEKMAHTGNGLDKIELYFNRVKPIFEKAVEELKSLDISSLS
jgi:signal transduction histidine kinase/FixJ family two-component response regulator